MAFVKDSDAHTRGVNAVAAFDRSGRGQALQRLKAKKMAQQDRALSMVARGALRGMGAIDAAKLGVVGGRRPVIVSGGNVESPSGGLVGQVGSGQTVVNPLGPKGVPGTVRGPARTGLQTIVLDPMSTKPPPRTPPGSRGVPTRLTPPGTRPVAPLPPPSSAPQPQTIPVVPVVVGSGGGLVTGGGGGGGSSGGGGGGSMVDSSSLFDDPPAPVDTSSSSTLKTALLVGGGLLAAYLIFGKDD